MKLTTNQIYNNKLLIRPFGSFARRILHYTWAARGDKDYPRGILVESVTGYL